VSCDHRDGGDDNLIGTASPDTILGLAATTHSMARAARIADRRTGNDTYIVDSQGDRTTEFPGEGTDTVQSSVATRSRQRREPGPDGHLGD